MYAIIATGGKQYKVEEGRFIDVELLPQAIDEKVTFDRVLLVANGDKVSIGAPLVAGAKVTGKVLISKANLLTVVRLKPADLKPTSARNAADGIVAFSSLCTHYGCPITTLHPSQTQIVCNCHGSVFDAANRGAVTQGPATRRLAMLPLTLKDGALVVSGKFDGPLGPPTT